MREIRLALKYRFDLTRYARLGYSGEVLRQIRLAKRDDVDLTFSLMRISMHTSLTRLE